MNTTATPNPFAGFQRSALEQSIPARFEEVVRRYPKRLAVKAGPETLTYDELNLTANQIADAILAIRGRGEDPIIILLEQGSLLVAAILGSLKAGKIYVPLDPTFSAQRLAEVLEDSQASLVVTSARIQKSALKWVTDGVQVLVVDNLAHGLATADHELSIKADAGAYIYYTSGSTGRPKGVLDTHRNVLHNIMRYTNSLQISPDDRLTLLQGPSFSGAVSSLFSALLNGAAVFPFDVHKEGVDCIAAWLRREKITIYHSVPVLFRHVATGSEIFPDLRLIRLEGDRASVKDIELFKSRFAGTCRLVNGLGATECGIVRQYFVGLDTPTPNLIVPIGYKVEDMDVILLDDSGQEVRAGEVGEICVSSHYLSPGYWRKPDFTAAAFIENPKDTRLRLYRTGDIGRMRDGECLEYLGRRDLQVKIRGHRVVVAEVESALQTLRGVKAAAVVMRQDKEGESRLVAYVVPDVHESLTTSSLRRQMVARLPHFMVPSVFVMLSALPLDANGKVDRRALPTPDQCRPKLEEAFVAPQTLLQDQLARVWERVLGITPVGIKDDFFDLGGDSLLAVTMMVEVEGTLQRKVPLSLLLAGTTIEYLADAIRLEATELLAAIVPIQLGNGGRPFFFLHGDYWSGGFYCTALARHIGRDQPFYALPPCGLNGEPVPPSYTAMAKKHVEAIRTVQPEGPYQLGGLCNGGLVAYEIARLLEQSNQKVEILVLVGALAANARYEWLLWLPRQIGAVLGLDSDKLLGRFVRLRDRIANIGALPTLEILKYVWRNSKKIRMEFRRLLAPRTEKGDVAQKASSELRLMTPEDMRGHLRETYLTLDYEYAPGPYGGRVTLLWPADDPVSLKDVIVCWQRVAHSVDAHVIPGRHFTCLTEHAQSTAAELRSMLSKVLQEKDTDPTYQVGLARRRDH